MLHRLKVTMTDGTPRTRPDWREPRFGVNPRFGINLSISSSRPAITSPSNVTWRAWPSNTKSLFVIFLIWLNSNERNLTPMTSALFTTWAGLHFELSRISNPTSNISKIPTRISSLLKLLAVHFKVSNFFCCQASNCCCSRFCCKYNSSIS